MSELKRCPFCGCECSVEDSGHHITLYEPRRVVKGRRVACGNLDCPNDYDYPTDAEAIKEWNRRPIEDELREQVEAWEWYWQSHSEPGCVGKVSDGYVCCFEYGKAPTDAVLAAYRERSGK